MTIVEGVAYSSVAMSLDDSVFRMSKQNKKLDQDTKGREVAPLPPVKTVGKEPGHY